MTPSLHQAERQGYAMFASRDSEDKYRQCLANLYASWREINADYFGSQLVEPHLALGRTAPRNLGHCSPTTDYGGKVQIVLKSGLFFDPNNPALVFDPNPDLIVQPGFTGDGTKGMGTEKFIQDLLLRFTVQQFVLEVEGADERGYRGFGPRFKAQANRIGLKLGLAPVEERNRGTDAPSPLARGWPHCVRPSSYYLNDVTEHALDLARGMPGLRRRGEAVPTEGLLEVLHFRLSQGRVDDARRMIERHLEWVRSYRHRRPRRQAERGSEDMDGKMPGELKFDRAWLDGNGAIALRLAQAIHTTGCFWDMPILADALQDAGCTDEQILKHLYASMEHGRRCWVLRLLLTLDPD